MIERNVAIDNDVFAEMEDTEDDSPLDVAPDRRRVKTEKVDLPVETLYTWVVRGKVNPQPEFQRYYVWDNKKASRLVESLLLEIPIPVIYVAEEANKTFSVVDGQQRVTSLSSFISGKFPDGRDFALTGLQVLTELNGKLYRQLSSELQEAIQNALMRLVTIKHDSDPNVKFEVFERLNLGAVKLNDQELRNSMYRGKYNDLLRELSPNSYLLKIRGDTQPHNRMQDRQLILRFFAMWRNTPSKYKGPMKTFLNTEMERRRNPSDKELAELRAVFEKAIEMAYSVFGASAFKRFNAGKKGAHDGRWEATKLNVALWDTLMYTFSFYNKEQIMTKAGAILEEFLDLITTDGTFIEYISSTTDKPDRIQYRAEVWRERLDAIVSNEDATTYSLEFKQTLYDANATCAICNQRIRNVDDAQIEDIPYYWRGRKRIAADARLSHRYCIRIRDGRNQPTFSTTAKVPHVE